LARGGLSEFNNGSTGREYRKLFIRQMRHERAEKKGKINFMIRSMIAEERDGSKKKQLPPLHIMELTFIGTIFNIGGKSIPTAA
jgi:hypothetical protein